MTIIAVTGSRSGTPSSLQLGRFARLLLQLCDKGNNTLRHGAATGIDTEVGSFVEAFLGAEDLHPIFRISVVVDAYPIDHKLDGPWPAAGPRRNKRMLLGQKTDNLVHRGDELADSLIAFPGGKGTLSCRTIARRFGIETFSWSDKRQDFVLDNL